jgi:thiamine biosynthesis lipoprotein
VSAALAGASPVHGHRFAVFGSTGRIRVAGVDAQRAGDFVAAAVAWLRDVERRLTRFSADSLVGRLIAAAGSAGVRPDADLDAVLDAADLAWRSSDGRLDATVLPLWRCWHAAARTTWPTPAELAAARALVAWDEVRRGPGLVALPRAGMAIDLGGVGKEWAVDQVIARAAAAGIADCLVELGGDCAARGHQPGRAGWWVALPGAAAALELRDEALATSGNGARSRVLAGRAVSHLVDARSGQPAGGALRAVSLLAATCLEAGIRASDCCLLARADAACLAQRAGGLPLWALAQDGTLLADPRLAARVHPIAPATAAA